MDDKMARNPEPPFSVKTHLFSGVPTEEEMARIRALRSLLEAHTEVYDPAWATQEQLFRCLVAKSFDMDIALALALDALKWRKRRSPHLVERTDGWQRAFEIECETGKVYNPGFDQWRRPVIVFDNSSQNTSNVDGQMMYLGWALNFACREMDPDVDKYTVFMHLSTFSFFSIPSMAATVETIHMLCSAFPERLGHCIAYKPPSVFKTFFNSVKSFIDPKTAAKMVFITGDVSEGSKNDLLLREIIGPNWKDLTGAEQPILQKTSPPSSPGYLHSRYWPALMERLKRLQEREMEAERAKQPTTAAEEGPAEAKAGDVEVCDDGAVVSKSSDTVSAPSVAQPPSKNSSPTPQEGSRSVERGVWEDLWRFAVSANAVLDEALGDVSQSTKLFLKLSVLAHSVFNYRSSRWVRLLVGWLVFAGVFVFMCIRDLPLCQEALHRGVASLILHPRSSSSSSSSSIAPPPPTGRSTSQNHHNH